MFSLPNKEQSLSILRNVVSLISGILVGKGILSAEQAVTFTNEIMIAAPALVSIGVIVWGLVAHTDKAQVQSVASMPAPVVVEALNKVSDVTKIQIAEAVPSVATVVVKDTANGTVAALAQSSDHPNIVTETQNAIDAKNGTGGTKS